MAEPEPRPFVWWVKAREAACEPDRLVMYGDGRWWGFWDDGRSWPFTDDDMRRCGFERCFCSPLDDWVVAVGCPAHDVSLPAGGSAPAPPVWAL